MLEILGLILIGIGIAGVVSLIVITIAEQKYYKRNEEDIYKILEEWTKHHKEVQIPVNTIKPNKYVIRKRYSFDLINAVPRDYLRDKIKNDFAEEFKNIIEPYFMVDTDFDYACQEVTIVLWVARDGEFDGSIDDIGRRNNGTEKA